MKDMGHHGVGDTDIEYRIIEVEKSATREEEKVKEALYDALEDKKKIIEDLKEQLAFRNSALEHEITQRLGLEEDRKGLVYRLESLLSEPQALSTTEETQTETRGVQARGCQTLPESRKCTRAASSQTWVRPGSEPSDKDKDRLSKQVQHLTDELTKGRRDQIKAQESFNRRFADLKSEYTRKTESITESHFHQEKTLGETVSKVQAESNTLRKQLDSLLGQLDEANERLLLSEMGSDSDTVDGSGFCCAPVKSKKKKKKNKGKINGLPNPYGLHTSERQKTAFWNQSDI